MYLNEVDTADRANNLNLIRFCAATSVTFGHSYPLATGNHHELIPGLLPSNAFGFYAVAVFFGLSGLLITQSFLRRRTWFAYLEARWLRIFPGYFFANALTAIVVSQFVLYEGAAGLWNSNNWRFSFGAFFFDSPYLNGVFAGNPINATNGSVWTLPLEFRLYLFVLVFGLLGLFKHRILALIFFLALVACVYLQMDFVVYNVFKILFRIKSYDGTYLVLPYCFWLGILALLYSEKLRIEYWIALPLLALIPVIDHWAYRAAALVYAALTFGYHPRFYIPKLNFKADLSYGIYVLSYPTQQVLVFHKLAITPVALFFTTMAIVLPLAFLSWTLVEKPSLRLKGILKRKSAVERTGEVEKH